MKNVILLVVLFLGGFLPAFGQGLYFLSDCSHKTFCLPSMACDSAAVHISVGVESFCSAPSISWQVDLFNNSSIDLTGGGDTFSDTIPKGMHFIRFRAADFCGNVKYCAFTFSVEDCTAPFLTCISSFTVNLDGPVCNQTFNAETFILNMHDNCTPSAGIAKGLRRRNAGTGFPMSDTIQLGRCDVGFQQLEVWVRDSAGRFNNCTTTLAVLDNDSTCTCDTIIPPPPPPPAPILHTLTMDGCVRRPNGTDFFPYNINLKTSQFSGTDTTANTKTQLFNSSCYLLSNDSLVDGADHQFEMSIFMDSLQLLGVNTYDLLLIQKHILGVQPITNLYQLIAADVNKSGTITPSDIIDIRKLILGINQNFQAGSFVFTQAFQNPLDLSNFPNFSHLFRPKLTVEPVVDSIIWHLPGYVAIKIGDMSGNGLDSVQVLDDRSVLPLRLGKSTETKGEWEAWSLSFPQDTKLDALQFALGFNADLVDVLVTEDLPTGLYANRLGDEIRFSFVEQDATLKSIQLWLRWKTTEANTCPFSLKTETISAEAYGQGRYPLQLLYTEHKDANCWSLWPNPVQLGEPIFLQDVDEKQDKVVVQIFQANGQLLKDAATLYPSNLGGYSISSKGLSGGQLYFLKIQSGSTCQMQRFYVK